MTPDALQVPDLMRILEAEALEKEGEPWAELTISPKRFLAAIGEAYAILGEKDKEIRKLEETFGLPGADDPLCARLVDSGTFKPQDPEVLRTRRTVLEHERHLRHAAELELSTLKAAAEAMTAANEALRNELAALRESSAKKLKEAVKRVVELKSPSDGSAEWLAFNNALDGSVTAILSLIPATERSTT